MLQRAYDISNFSGFLTAEKATGLVASGPLGIVRIGKESGWFNGNQWIFSRQQLLALHTAGSKRLDGYLYLSFVGDPAAQVAAALETAQGFALGALWLDCEDDYASQLSVEATIAVVEKARAAVALHGLATGIYTSRGWWQYQVGGSAAFKDLPLWLATNDGVPDMGMVPFGGWQAPSMEQFKFDVQLAGVNVDINVFDDCEIKVGG